MKTIWMFDYEFWYYSIQFKNWLNLIFVNFIWFNIFLIYAYKFEQTWFEFKNYLIWCLNLRPCEKFLADFGTSALIKALKINLLSSTKADAQALRSAEVQRPLENFKMVFTWKLAVLDWFSILFFFRTRFLLAMPQFQTSSPLWLLYPNLSHYSLTCF